MSSSGSSTFRAAVSTGSRLYSWKTNPMCRARHADSLPPDSLSMRSPATVIDPSLGVSSPPIRFSSVVLPEPDGPISDEVVPFRDIEVDALEDVDALAAALKHLVEIANRDESIRHRYCTFTLSPSLSVARAVHDDPFARTHAGQHFHLIAVLEADADRAPLDAIVFHDEHDRLAVRRADRRLRHQHARRRRRAPARPARLLAQERDLHAHVGQDPRVQRVEPDADLHRGLLPVGCRNRRDDVRRDLPVLIRVEHRLDAACRSSRG